MHTLFGQKINFEKSVKIDSEIKESSGLIIASDTSFYTINDGGNTSVLYEINHSGKIIRKIKINAPNRDWEDLSLDEKGNLYIGDIGNNLNKRQNLSILKIKKSKLSQSTITPEIFLYFYEDQKAFPPKDALLNYDCEGFIVRNDTAFLFSKNRSIPFDGAIRMYALNIKSNSKKAILWNHIPFCDSGWLNCSITSVDYNFKTKELILLSYTSIVRIKNIQFRREENLKKEIIKLGKLEQFESICFTGNKEIYLSSEVQMLIGGGKLHKVQLND